MLTRLPVPLGLAGAALLLVACGGNPPPDSTLGGDPDVITRQQIETLGMGNALDVIRRLRPNWLRSRSATGREEPVVYVDAARRGGIQSLSYVSVEIIDEIRYFSGPDATTRFGTGHRGGAIVIRTRR